MKLVNLNFLLTILVIVCERKHFIYSKIRENNPIKKFTSEFILQNLKEFRANLTNLYDNLYVYRNSTKHINEDIIIDNDLILDESQHPKLDIKIKPSSIMNTVVSLNNSLGNLRNFQNSLENKLKDFETLNTNENNTPHIRNKKKKVRKEDDENSFVFYNSLSLIMLSMLAGGLLGVVFILYFSFKKDTDLEHK